MEDFFERKGTSLKAKINGGLFIKTGYSVPWWGDSPELSKTRGYFVPTSYRINKKKFVELKALLKKRQEQKEILTKLEAQQKPENIKNTINRFFEQKKEKHKKSIKTFNDELEERFSYYSILVNLKNDFPFFNLLNLTNKTNFLRWKQIVNYELVFRYNVPKSKEQKKNSKKFLIEQAVEWLDLLTSKSGMNQPLEAAIKQTLEWYPGTKASVLKKRLYSTKNTK